MRYSYLLLILFLSCNSLRKSASTTKVYNPVIAHRGAFKKLNLPENSLAALMQAMSLGCAGSEFDVYMTADSVLVVNHDPHYYGLVIEATDYAELAKHKLYNGESIPQLKDFLAAGLHSKSNTKFICEIKQSFIKPARGQATAAKVLALVNELKLEQRMVYISFDYDILLKILSIQPNAITQYLAGDKTPLAIKKDGITGADYHLSVFKNHPEWIEMAKQENIFLNAWTVNDMQDMQWLLQNKFDGITTNEPELLFELLQKK